ncbi:MAG: TlpA disulfide reductase family protein [Caulobacteraceae bacterium]
MWAVAKQWRIGPLAAAGLFLITALPAHGTADGARAKDGLAGRWQGQAQLNGAEIPFRLDLSARGGQVRATFFDGSRPTNPSAPGVVSPSGRLQLSFPSYAAVLDASVTDLGLEGTYTRGRSTLPITARKAPPPAPGQGAPSIAGEWIIPGVTAKGEKAWRLIVHQAGGRAEATILRIDGDTGTLNGVYADGAFRLSHFAGERPALLEIRAPSPRQLKLSLTDGEGHKDLVAVRPREALAQGVAPSDPTRFTSVADPAAPFSFAFPDLSGRTVASTDKRFRGKVVLVDVMGSWCPNCHDEAPFLQSLYARHHRQGLEVVALDFEQSPEQVADPQRLKAFVQRYGLTYSVLLAGETKTVHEKLPQAVNLSAWPTTFFIGRDGRVKAVHVGFTSPGSGARDRETRAEVEKQVEALLAGAKAG